MKISATTFFVLVLTPALAQDYQLLPAQPGTWQNKTYEERLTPYKLSADEKKVLLDKTQKLCGLLKTYPEFIQPKGWEIIATTELRYLSDPSEYKPQSPLPLNLTLMLAEYYRRNGKVGYSQIDEPHHEFQFTFNDPEHAFSGCSLFYEKLMDADGSEIMLEPVPVTTFGGVTLYSNSRLLITRPGKKLWIPVTGKQYFEASLRALDDKIRAGDSGAGITRDMIKKEMESWSAADLGKPAYVNNTGETISGFTPEKSEFTMALVKLNPEYFDRSKPRSATQLLSISTTLNHDFREPIENGDPRFNDNDMRVYEFLKSFDFRKLQALIE